MKIHSRVLSLGVAPLAALFVLSSSGCASTGVRHETTPEFAAGSHKTFRLVTPQIGASGTVAESVSARLRDKLIEKGYAPVDETPDVVVTWKVLVDGGLTSVPGGGEAAAMQGQNALMAMNAGVDPMMAGGDTGTETESKKTLIVFVQDAETLDVLWVGWTQANVSKSTLEERSLQSVEEVVAGLPDRMS